jgi:methenyltetrahydromethanopterin cyclohydrolase
MVPCLYLHSVAKEDFMSAHAKALVLKPSLNVRALLVGTALFSLIASIFSMAAIYGDPLAHIKICLGGSSSALADANAVVLYGHCGWCYLAVGLALAALIAPGNPTKH